MDFVDKNLIEKKPVNPLPLDETSFKIVEEVKDLKELAATLQSVEEFAASRVLKLERKSLEFLLKHYCGVAANKEYQNADWRIRPLPNVMTRYATSSDHRD